MDMHSCNLHCVLSSVVTMLSDKRFAQKPIYTNLYINQTIYINLCHMHRKAIAEGCICTEIPAFCPLMHVMLE